MAEICEIMISHTAKELNFVTKLADRLKQNGWSVWFSDPKRDPKVVLNEKGSAIVNCKVFIAVLNENTAVNVTCRDELALSYISNSSVIPVATTKYRDLLPYVDSGKRLMLAKINWTFFLEGDDFDKNFEILAHSVKTELESKQGEETIVDADNLLFHGLNMHVNFTDEKDDTNEEEGKKVLKYDFWDRHFGKKTEVTWIEFRDKFQLDYNDKITEQYSEEQVKFFVNIMYKDVINLSKSVTKTLYVKFCDGNPNADPHRFYNRLQQFSVGYYAMREVFSMDSSFRLTAIRNLGAFSSPAVIAALTEMLKDTNANIRAVAAIAIARSGKSTKKTVDNIMRLLEDEDRLVRESACFSLGYLKATRTVPEIINRWRNDPISHVREAAQTALKMIGGDEAQKCIKVTQVLTDEMSSLRSMKN